jgi:hypothetical protein
MSHSDSPVSVARLPMRPVRDESIGAVRRFQQWLDTWVMLFLCVLMIGISVAVIPLSLAADRNEGTFGTFTAVRKDCDRYSCGWEGEFESDDGRIHLDDAFFDDQDLKHPGDQARAQKVQGDESLYKPDDKFWALLLVADVGCLGYVAWWVRSRRWRGPRKQQAASTER